MRDDVRKDILEILKKSCIAVKEKDVRLLKDLSNNTLHDASIYQDEYSTTIAVMIYSLSKIFERSNFTQYKSWSLFNDVVVENLKKAEESLSINDIREYENSIKNIFDVIDKLDSKLRFYIAEVIERAKINKASRVHEHGISIGRTAELLGVDEWELMEYVGNTGISDVEFSLSKTAKDRLNLARKLFNSYRIKYD